MRLTQVALARLTASLHVRATRKYVNSRGDFIDPTLRKIDPSLQQFAGRISDPAHDRWYYQKERFDETFEWDLHSLAVVGIGCFAIFAGYYLYRQKLNEVNIMERGITLRQIESEHNSIVMFEPFTAEMDYLNVYDFNTSHDFTPVFAGRYRNGYRC